MSQNIHKDNSCLNLETQLFMPREIEVEQPKLNLKICSSTEPVYYTGIPIPVKVALTDPGTGDVAKCAEAINVEFDVLHEVFDSEDGQEWSAEYYSKIVDGEDGRGLLRENNRRVLLKEGVGVTEILFKHSRLWFGKCRYRFGARVVGQYCGPTIREARTKPFWVQDRRGMSKRVKSLQLSAKIWEIKGIGKKGRLRDLLIRRNIVTVENFLVEYHLHLHRLKQIFEEANASNKWEAICEHALSCQISEKRYLYTDVFGETSVVFNTVGELLGMMLGGDQYVSLEEITEEDKVRGRELIMFAFQHWKDVEPFIMEKKRQQLEDVYDPLNPRNTSESSCSYASKRQRTSEREVTVNTPNDHVLERDIADNFGVGEMNNAEIDSLLLDSTSAYCVQDFSDAVVNNYYYTDYIHDQSWSPHSEVESILRLSAANLINGQVHTGDTSSMLQNCSPETSDCQTAEDVYRLWEYRI